MGKDYGVAYYLRLSRSDGDFGANGKDESYSIENQRNLLAEFQKSREDLGGSKDAEAEELPHFEYVDDGYSGGNFNRPSFRTMIEDCKTHKVKVILVKDLSRLGREYIEVGDYIEQIFPLLGVRFISVNDNFDSAASVDGTMGLGMAIENLVNTMYLKDCSKKRIASLKVKWKQGKPTSSRVPYGYRFDNFKSGHWDVDKEAAKVVKTIFALACKGHDTSSIASHLNAEGLPTPYLYMKQKGDWYGKKATCPEKELRWTTSMVWRIIRNEAYTGTLVQGKRYTVMLGKDVRRDTKDHERYKTENAHEALVSEEDFARAQMVIASRKAKYMGETSYALKGVIRCGVCRRMMHYEALTGREVMFCSYHPNSGYRSNCPEEHYPLDMLSGTVLTAIRNMTLLAEDLVQKIENKGIMETEEMESEVKALKAQLVRKYEDYVDGHISREEYLREKAAVNEQIKSVQDRITEAIEVNSRRTATLDELTVVSKLGAECNKGLTREMVKALIKAVYVYSKDHIEVVFKSEDAIRAAIEECELTAK